MKRNLVALTLLVAILGALVVPAATPTTHAATTHRTHAAAFDKTRFVLHLGVAAFMVHYVYKKYKDGKLSHFHMFTIIKAAAATLIAVHEMKKAYDIAKTSNSKTLQLLIKPMTALTSTINTAYTKLKHGDTSGLNAANSQENSFASLASKDGYGFKDTTPSGFSNF